MAYTGLQFELPDELVAQEPANPRDSARLLVYNRSTSEIIDDVFYNLNQHLNPQTTLVLNNTKVDHCRLLFDDQKTEIFVLQKLDDRRVTAMVRPGKKFRLSSTVELSSDLKATVKAIDESGVRTIEFSCAHDDPRVVRHQHVPLPPYIAQNDTLAAEYQTVYADQPGSKAAPTAGLHFTPGLLREIHASHEIAELTLEVGLGTFAPLTDENFDTQTLHEESWHITQRELSKLKDSSHVTAVGTTSLRTLESLPRLNRLKNVSDRSGSTDIFITPGYRFKNVDSLVTNFHLPGTSLLLLLEAFIGDMSETKRIYEHAINNKYRFYSFGDAMLVL